MESLLCLLAPMTLHETCDDDDEPFCFACMDLVIGGPAYIIERDDHGRDYLHKSCAELPGKIQHHLHPQHPLTVRHRRDGFICDGCRHVSFGYEYRCKECKFKLDFQCASKNEGQAPKERVRIDTIYHPQKLEVVYFHSSVPTRLYKKIVCCCCLKSCPDGRDPTYFCNIRSESKMSFYIHKSCLDRVPRQVQSSFHPEHPLFIQRAHSESVCVVCTDEIKGFALTCEKCCCQIEFHVSCGSRTTRGIRLNIHQHDIHYVIPESPRMNYCNICKADHRWGAFYRCVECNVNMYVRCCLPKTVEHESHDHPLKLTKSVVTHRVSDEYRCDICEEEGNIKHHSYYCKECNYIAHIHCVCSEHEISCLDPSGKGEAEEETEDGKEGTEDAELETDDAEEETEDGNEETEDTEVETGDAEEETEDGNEETEDAEVETDDAEEETDDEVYETDSSVEEQYRRALGYCSDTSEHSSNDEVYETDNSSSDESSVDVLIENIRKTIEKLALQLEADVNLKADLEVVLFQLEDLRKKFSKFSRHRTRIW